MKNKDKYDLRLLKITESKGKTGLDYFLKYVEIEYDGKFIKEYVCTDKDISEKFFAWLEEEYKPTILTEKENAYLSAVIKPFRKDVECIEKLNPSCLNGKQYLRIELINDYFTLPIFAEGTMYQGMEANKRYTLEELGL